MSKYHRISTFQANYVLALSGCIKQKTIDLRLLFMMISGSLSYIYFFCFFIIEISLVYQVIIKDDVGGFNGFCCLDGQQLWVTRTETYQGYGALLIENAFGSECLLQSLAADSLLDVGLQIRRNLRSSSVSIGSAFFQSCDGKETLKRMGWEREYFGDFILHSQSL